MSEDGKEIRLKGWVLCYVNVYDWNIGGINRGNLSGVRAFSEEGRINVYSVKWRKYLNDTRDYGF